MDKDEQMENFIRNEIRETNEKQESVPCKSACTLKQF
jgi:hypothetical protein